MRQATTSKAAVIPSEPRQAGRVEGLHLSLAARTFLLALLAAIALTLAPSARAQNGVESNIPGAGFGPPPPQTAQLNVSAPTLQVYSRETIVDVTVTDDHGNPVHGLKPSDFTLLEDSKPVTPSSFTEHGAAPPATDAPTVPAPLPPNTFTNLAPTAPATAAPPNVLLIDSLNTPMWAQVQVRQQALDYLKTMPPGTRMAVFGLSTHLFVIQSFTTDRDLLAAAIRSSEKLMPMSSSFEDIGQEGPNIDLPETLEQQGDNMARRGQIIFPAIAQLTRYLSGVPGRKNLIWATASFPLQFPPEPRDPDAWPPDLPPIFDYANDVKLMSDSLARAHIAVYSIEPRGLDKIIHPGQRKPILEYAEHSTMDEIAELTGGSNTHNTNGITQAIAAAVNDGSSYYTLTYVPPDRALDSRFRSIKVKVDRPALHLTYRDGYYALSPGTALSGKKLADPITPMQAAMQRGSLAPTQVLFTTRITQSPAPASVLPIGNQPDAKLLRPPFRIYSIAYSVDVHNIQFTQTPDGNYRAGFELAVALCNPDGDTILNSTTKTVSPILPPAVYQSMLRSGAAAHLDIAAPAAGDYFLRIAVHDLASDQVGAIEVPTASIQPSASSNTALPGVLPKGAASTVP